jgi:hypothetical protein
MVSPLKFPFIDATHAAEILHATQDKVVDWVAEGRLRSYGGKPNNPFLKSTDVAELAQELGLEESDAPRRTKSASAKVQARLTADSRWSDISNEDIEDWARRADQARRQAAKTAASEAIGRLESLLNALDKM